MLVLAAHLVLSSPMRFAGGTGAYLPPAFPLRSPTTEHVLSRVRNVVLAICFPRSFAPLPHPSLTLLVHVPPLRSRFQVPHPRLPSPSRPRHLSRSLIPLSSHGVRTRALTRARASNGRERARMTYAELSHLYILRRAVRRNLRRCHRHSSPTPISTYSVPLLPLRPPAVPALSLCSIAPISVFYRSFSFSFSYFSGAFTDLFAFLISFSAFLFLFLPSCTSNIKSRLLFSHETDIDIFFGNADFFQSLL